LTGIRKTGLNSLSAWVLWGRRRGRTTRCQVLSLGPQLAPSRHRRSETEVLLQPCPVALARSNEHDADSAKDSLSESVLPGFSQFTAKVAKAIRSAASALLTPPFLRVPRRLGGLACHHTKPRMKHGSNTDEKKEPQRHRSVFYPWPVFRRLALPPSVRFSSLCGTPTRRFGCGPRPCCDISR
jgi:hypothetical protein